MRIGSATRAATCPCWCPTSAGSTVPSSSGCRHVAIFGSATETFARKNLNRSLDEQFAMFEPVVRRARDAGLDVRAYVSMCFGDPWEGAVPIEQVVGVGKRLFDLGASQLSLGDTIGVGTAGHVGALVDAFAGAGHEPRRPRAALPRHLRPGAVQRPGRAARRRHDVRRERRRPRRLPLRRRAPPATSPPRTWSGCSPGSASSTASTSTLSSRPAPGWPAISAGRARRPSSAPSPAEASSRPGAIARLAQSAHEPEGVRAHRCAQDRYDVPPGPARPQREVAGRP